MNLTTSNTRTKEFNKISKKSFYKSLFSKNPTIIELVQTKDKQ